AAAPAYRFQFAVKLVFAPAQVLCYFGQNMAFFTVFSGGQTLGKAHQQRLVGCISVRGKHIKPLAAQRQPALPVFLLMGGPARQSRLIAVRYPARIAPHLLPSCGWRCTWRHTGSSLLHCKWLGLWPAFHRCQCWLLFHVIPPAWPVPAV